MSVDGFDEERRRRRGHWSGAEFIFTSISTSIGLASFTNFSNYCLKYGAVFFVPAYLIQLALVGAPCLCLEMFVGQFGGVGTVTVLGRAVPLAKGVGIGMLLVQMLVMSYYAVINSYLGYYLVIPLIMNKDLPWHTCVPAGGPDCNPDISNSTDAETIRNYPETQFLINRLLQPKIPNEFSLEELGLPHTHLAIALAVIWGIAFICLVFGIKFFGKMAYLCIFVPLSLTIALLIRALTLPGSVDGLLHYLGPVSDTYQSDWNKELKYKNPIEQAKMWHDATKQVFISLGLGHGVYITLASHNKFFNRIYRSAFIVILSQLIASLAFTALVAALLGYLSHSSGVPLPHLAHPNGIRFILITLLQSTARLPSSSLWSALLLCLILSLTLGCLMPYAFSIMSSLRDELQCCLSGNKSSHYTCCTSALLTSLVITLLYLTGMIYTTQTGGMFMDIIDHHVTTWPVYILLFFFIISFAWFYPVSRLYRDVRLMIGQWDRCYLLAVCWTFITPIIVLLLLAYYVYDEWIEPDHAVLEPLRSRYPWWSVCVGWTAALLPLVFIPLWMIFKSCYVCAVHGRCSKLCASSESWRSIRSENLPAYSPLLTHAQVQTRETRSTQTSAKVKRKHRGGDSNGSAARDKGGVATPSAHGDYHAAPVGDMPPPRYNDDLEDGWMVGTHRNYPAGGGYYHNHPLPPGPSAPPMEGTYQYRPIYPTLTLGESRF